MAAGMGSRYGGLKQIDPLPTLTVKKALRLETSRRSGICSSIKV
jgi:hypothetical protein